jgi:hypothetical protein
MKRWPVAIVLLLVGGCGTPLATGEFKPPYVTLSGRIESMVATLPDQVRVALLWQYLGNGGYATFTTRDLSIQSQFPARFRFDVTTLPQPPVIRGVPAGVFPPTDVDPTTRWAIGTLVIYGDNGNGVFDIAPAIGQSPDRVLAVNEDLDFFYLAQGRPAASSFVGIVPVAPGFSLVREPPRRDPLPGECGQFTPQGHLTELCDAMTDTAPQPLDPAATEIDLTLVDDALLERYACSSYWGPPAEHPDWSRAQSGEICDGPSCKYCRGYNCALDVPPTGTAVRCNGDGTAYVFKTCVDEPTLCGTRFCHFGHGERQLGDPIPAGWPCP